MTDHRCLKNPRSYLRGTKERVNTAFFSDEVPPTVSEPALGPRFSNQQPSSPDFKSRLVKYPLHSSLDKKTPAEPSGCSAGVKATTYWSVTLLHQVEKELTIGRPLAQLVTSGLVFNQRVQCYVLRPIDSIVDGLSADCALREILGIGTGWENARTSMVEYNIALLRTNDERQELVRSGIACCESAFSRLPVALARDQGSSKHGGQQAAEKKCCVHRGVEERRSVGVRI